MAEFRSVIVLLSSILSSVAAACSDSAPTTGDAPVDVGVGVGDDHTSSAATTGDHGTSAGSGSETASNSAASSSGSSGTGGVTPGNICNPAWLPPAQLFEDELRLVAGTKLHAVGLNGGSV